VLLERARGHNGVIPLTYDALGDRLPRQRPFQDDEDEVGGGGVGAAPGGGLRGQGRGGRDGGRGAGGEREVEEIVLKRKKLNMPPVLSALLSDHDGRKFGYIRINYFSRPGTDQVASSSTPLCRYAVTP
jgi:hypothetical protein